MTTKRINPKDVAQAYLAKGLTPIDGEFTPVHIGALLCCCGLGALADGDVSGLQTLEQQFDLSFELYVAGFVDGFDGNSPSIQPTIGRLSTDHGYCEYMQGYVDGVEGHLASLRAVGLLTDEEVALETR